MKKIINFLNTNKYFILIFLFLLFLLPAAVSLPTETEIRGIITSIGIDKKDSAIEVSAQVFVPTASSTYKEKFEIVTVESNNIIEALQEIAIKIGKQIGLGHTSSIVFGKDILNEDISNLLDYFVRVPNLSNSAVLISTDKTAKDFIETSSALTVDGLINLRRVAAFNQNNVISSDISLESFFKGYYGPTKTSIISNINLVEKPAEAGASGGEVGAVAESPKYDLDNTGEVVIIKEGKKLDMLNEQDVYALNWLNPRSKSSFIEVDGVTNKELSNAKLIYNVPNKSVKFSASFENGAPVIDTRYVITLKLSLLENETTSIYNIQGQNAYFTEDVKLKIEEKIKTETNNFIAKLQGLNADIIGATNSFYLFTRAEFEKRYPTDADKSKIFTEIKFSEPTFEFKIDV